MVAGLGLMRVFITGATGYIGGAVLAAVRRAGHHVTGLVRSPQQADALARIGCDPHAGDIVDPVALAAGVEGADAVVHTAVGMGGGIVTAADEAAVDAMLYALAPRGGTFVLTSGVGIYNGYDDPLVDEFTPLDRVAAAQQPRVALEERVLAAAERGVRPVVLRPGHVYGDGRCGIFTRMLLEATAKAGHGVYVGDGFGLFAVVHIEDLAAAYLAALSRPEVRGRFNVVSANVAVRDVATAMSYGGGAGGRIAPISREDAAERWGPRAQALAGSPLISSVLATAALGWSPAGPSFAYELVHGSLKAAQA